MTWVTRPIWLAAVAMNCSPYDPNFSTSVGSTGDIDLACFAWAPRGGLHRLGTRDDFDQFLGDHRLAGAVIDQRLLADHLTGVARGVVHRGHLRAVERGVVLEQRAEDLHGDVARQEAGEDLVLLRLVLIERSRAGIGGRRLDDKRNDLLRSRDLRDDGP